MSFIAGTRAGSAAMRGRVIDSEEGRTLVRLKVPFDPSSSDPPTPDSFPAFESTQTWFLDRIPFSRGREVARQALFRFLEKADPAVVEAVVGTQPLAPPADLLGASGQEPPPPLSSEEPGQSKEFTRTPLQGATPVMILCFSEGLQSGFKPGPGVGSQRGTGLRDLPPGSWSAGHGQDESARAVTFASVWTGRARGTHRLSDQRGSRPLAYLANESRG